MIPETSINSTRQLVFIGSAGVPNRYGGFESFLEHCGPEIAGRVGSVTITCDRRLYPDLARDYCGMQRVFIGIPANGVWSVLHDLVAFMSVFRRSTHIVILGVSGAPWFPLFRLMSGLTGRRLLVNVDGLEWRRKKYSGTKRLILKLFDMLAQSCAHVIIYDNAGLLESILPYSRSKARLIAYSGDHVLRVPGLEPKVGTALTICRIEPENNIDMLIDGFLRSDLTSYTLVGNWSLSVYGRRLKERHAHEPRLILLEALYDPHQLASLRERCAVYIHGHSVGGTNPSLVEMLFYDCALLCFDVTFNRHTAGSCAEYFSSTEELASLLRGLPSSCSALADRESRRCLYSRQTIAAQYVEAAK